MAFLRGLAGICAALLLPSVLCPGLAASPRGQSAEGAPAPAIGEWPPVRRVPPSPGEHRFRILVWQYGHRAAEHVGDYEALGLRGFHVDRGAEAAGAVRFAMKKGWSYYVDHAASKGILHLTARTGRNEVLRRRGLLPRPFSLADPRVRAELRRHLRRNLRVARQGPVVAYAFDDEPALGSFNSPAEVDASPAGLAFFRSYLRRRYQGDLRALAVAHGREHASFTEVVPPSFEEVRRSLRAPDPSRWRLHAWLDWRSSMDALFADTLRALCHEANRIDPSTPAGLVGGQQPSAFGGYDYERLSSSLQWMEAYDIGATSELLRSLWAFPDRRPRYQTFFRTGDARRDAWFLWWALAHGHAGVIAWPGGKAGPWFPPGGVPRSLRALASVFGEIQGAIGEGVVDPEARLVTDPVAIWHDHRSVQVSWALDAARHGPTWAARSSSLDDANQTLGQLRVAWWKVLEDLGVQARAVTPAQVREARRTGRWPFRVLILPRALAIDVASARALEAFVEQGGVLVADHFAGLHPEPRAGESLGGHARVARLFGLRRDADAGYYAGRGAWEIDGEAWKAPMRLRLQHGGAPRWRGLVAVERGLRAAAPARARASIGRTQVLVESRRGRGRTLFLNLSPLSYGLPEHRFGAVGRGWRALLRSTLEAAGIRPAVVLVAADGAPAGTGLEVLRWRREEEETVLVLDNPVRRAGRDEAGAWRLVHREPVEVRLRWPERPRGLTDLRRGVAVEATGRETRHRLEPGEAVVLRWRPSS